MTEPRGRPVLAALGRGYRAEDLQAYLRWVFCSDARWARWMRRDDGRDYSDTPNLFRASHLRDHLQEALDWASGEEPASGGWVARYGDRTYSG